MLSIFFFLLCLILLFNAISEWYFWDEFSVRYNFIAVDYLIYTTEVIGNIRQSYPIYIILPILFLTAITLNYLVYKPLWASAAHPIGIKKRSIFALLLLILPTCTYFFVNHQWKNQSKNQYANELSGNGMYDFGFAFWHNQLDYDTFYPTLPQHTVASIAHKNILNDSTGSKELSTLRWVNQGKKEERLNVVLISVESLSADYLGSFGNTQQLTPNLDALAKQGILFTKLYASGTRTVRGLEALALSIPPTPGQSIIKRPGNRNMFTLGNVFRAKGYQSRFIYGGYAYFDNMKEFFENNGYEVTDRKALSAKNIHYENTWGVADEDLFALSLRKLDQDYQNGKPFFAHIMTVSNHRPFTYPEGRIDIPSHTGREGAVKYTDYAIGKFISECRLKPWFAQTLFVIVADHCASSAGKVELPVDKYHVPMIFYAPKFIKPAKFDKLTAQIDVAPTILGCLGMNYQSKFFGQDVFQMQPSQQRAFISTYQSLGFIKNDKLVILSPNKKIQTFRPNFDSGDAKAINNEQWLTDEAITNYQLAAYLYQHQGYNFK